MKHIDFEVWKTAVEEQHFTLKQVQGHENYEALDKDTVVGRWNGTDGHLGDGYSDVGGFVHPHESTERTVYETLPVETVPVEQRFVPAAVEPNFAPSTSATVGPVVYPDTLPPLHPPIVEPSMVAHPDPLVQALPIPHTEPLVTDPATGEPLVRP
jgi:hypothetical protein